jgi:hypothetical protein
MPATSAGMTSQTSVPAGRRLVTPMHRAVIASLAAAAALSAIPASAERPRGATPPVQIEVRAKPIAAFEPRDPQQRQFGALLFRGGLELTSPHRNFGGISAIRMDRDGARFLAVTDKAYWLRARILYQGDAPAGIADAEMAPILGPDGHPLASRRWYDAEALAEDGGTVYVGIERVHQIVRFDYGRHGLLARGQPIALPPQIKMLPRNQGIEGLVVVPRGLPLGGALLAISERGLDAAGNILGWIIGGPSPGEFAVTRRDDFDITDAAMSPGGDLLVLERRLSLLRGLVVRVRRIPLAEVRPGATVDGAVLMTADIGYQIDNMEGLAVHRSAAGDIVLTLVSDDNFSPLQRTLLLQFTLREP